MRPRRARAALRAAGAIDDRDRWNRRRARRVQTGDVLDARWRAAILDLLARLESEPAPPRAVVMLLAITSS